MSSGTDDSLGDFPGVGLTADNGLIHVELIWLRVGENEGKMLDKSQVYLSSL